jgi:hypothetical protein
VVLTAKDLSVEERRRLNGGVARVVRKRSPDNAAELLDEVRDVVAGRLATARGGDGA